MGAVLKRKHITIIEIDGENLSTILGKGLMVSPMFGAIPQVQVRAGAGLEFGSQGELRVEEAEDGTKCTTFTVLKNSSLSLDGRKLMLKKFLAEVIVERTCSGILKNIRILREWEESDEVFLMDYGYSGYSFTGLGMAGRPNFYQK